MISQHKLITNDAASLFTYNKTLSEYSNRLFYKTH